MRWQLLLLGCVVTLLSVDAVRWQLQEEENQSTKSRSDAQISDAGGGGGGDDRRLRRRNKSGGNREQQQQQLRQLQHQQQQLQQQQQQQRYHLRDSSEEEENEKEEEEQEDDDYWDDNDGEIGDTLESIIVEPVKSQNPAIDIFTCCNEVFGSCRTTCENVNLVQVTNDGDIKNIESELKKYCQLHQLEFWSCINNTLEAVSRGLNWSGRRCCQHGVLQHCRNACATGVTREQLIGTCRRSDESMLFDCFERQESADRCCGQARTSECLQACRGIFEPSDNQMNHGSNELELACGQRNSDVLQCVYNNTDMTPLSNAQQYLPCCDYSNNEQCRHTCRTLLQNATSAERSEVVYAKLEAANCGTPLPHLPFWQCFLTVTRKLYVPASGGREGLQKLHPSGAGAGGGGGEQPSLLGIDAAKRQCCEHSNSHRCRRLCTQVFSNDWWETRDKFDVECLEQPSELELRRCIDSVDSPCELGCDGLTFCTNFNNRPTELFRSCSTSNDEAAREDLRLLQQGGIVRVLGQELHIKNATYCAPAKWQALICALQLRPCTRRGLYNGICPEDCTELLDECLDWTRQQQRPQAFCERLKPAMSDDDEDAPCISLRAYMERGDAPVEVAGHYGLSKPCAGRPCNSSELCIPQRNGEQGYSCLPSCSLGQGSALSVPFGAYVRVGKTGGKEPAGMSLASSQLLMAEHVVCRCGLQGHVEQCQPLPSYTHDHCLLPGGRSFRHGSSFYLECNLCSCFAGEITCTKQQCRLGSSQFPDATYTSLPCNCPAHYVPVCGANGNTHPSACVAKCLGLQETSYVYGACNARSACQSHDCPVGTQCVEQRQICLATMRRRPCLQYICVNVTSSSASNCNHQEPLCDTQEKTHPNACELILAGNAQVAYWGDCLPSGGSSSSATCTQSGPVCGINGVTYRSSCAAWADYALVDYGGRCREVGLLAADMGRRCRTVKCPPVASKHCRNIVPPGACCPICAGGAFRIIYSRKQLDRAMYAIGGQQKSLLTLRAVLRQLDELVQISECQLTGFLTMEVGIFVALVPRGNHPSRLQLEACEREAEKISVLISSQSPRITTNLALSSFIESHMLEPSLPSGAGGSSSPTSPQVAASLLLSLLLAFLLPNHC